METMTNFPEIFNFSLPFNTQIAITALRIHFCLLKLQQSCKTNFRFDWHLLVNRSTFSLENTDLWIGRWNVKNLQFFSTFQHSDSHYSHTHPFLSKETPVKL